MITFKDFLAREAQEPKSKPMQAILKSNLKPAGTYDEVFDRNAEQVADAVQDKLTSKLYVVGTDNPQAAAAVKGALASNGKEDIHGAKIIVLPGSNRVIAWKDKLYVGEFTAGRLID